MMFKELLLRASRAQVPRQKLHLGNHLVPRVLLLFHFTVHRLLGDWEELRHTQLDIEHSTHLQLECLDVEHV